MKRILLILLCPFVLRSQTIYINQDTTVYVNTKDTLYMKVYKINETKPYEIKVYVKLKEENKTIYKLVNILKRRENDTN